MKKKGAGKNGQDKCVGRKLKETGGRDVYVLYIYSMYVTRRDATREVTKGWRRR